MGGGRPRGSPRNAGLQAYASDLNPVAVLICKAMIEIPPKFARLAPVNPESRKEKSLIAREWKGAQGLAEDVRYYGQWMRDEAEKRIGHLYPKVEVTAGGESAAAELVAKLGAKAEIARELAYRLYTVCERKKRAPEALSYNGLVQGWPEITRLARGQSRFVPAQHELPV